MIKSGGIKRYNSVKFLVVDEVDACLLIHNNNGNNNNFASSGTAWQISGTPLHELLSKYLSPTYDDGKEAAMESDSAIATSGGNAALRPLSR